MNIRKYQADCLDAIEEHFVDHDATLAVLPTGGGKTIVFAELLRRRRGKGRAMVLAHRMELIDQAAEKIAWVTDLPVDVEMADRESTEGIFKAPIVVSSVQTQISGRVDNKRMHKFDPFEFATLVIDECFPGHTIVSGRRIDRIRIGDSVDGGVVTRLFVKQADVLVELKLSNGTTLVCTPNHPIYDGSRFVPAGLLTCGSMVATITRYEEMRNLQRAFAGTGEANGSEESGSPQAVREEVVPIGSFQGADLQDAREAWRADYQVSQDERYAPARSSSIGFDEASGNGVVSDSSRREWHRSHRTSDGARFVAWVGYGSGDTDQGWASERGVSESLQSGHCEQSLEGGYRGGRKQPRGLRAEIAGREKDRPFELARVDRVEVHERGGRGEFGRVCPDGYVYNLEIAPSHVYCANGVVVHNCHHAPADSYRNIIDWYRQNPKLKVLGVTATPNRNDQIALGSIFDSCAFKMTIRDAVAEGWLVPVKVKQVRVAGLDLSGVGTVAGDFNQRDLGEAMSVNEVVAATAMAALEHSENRKTLIFTSSVKQAQLISSFLNGSRPGSSRFVCGETNYDERKDMVNGFRDGKFQFLVNYSVLLEGFDVWDVSCVVCARPTKNSLLLEQMIGRGTRPNAAEIDGLDKAGDRRAAILCGTKPNLLVIDFVGRVGRHTVARVLDVLGGKLPEEVRALADSKMSGGEQDVDRAIQEARDELAAKKIRGKVKYSRISQAFDLFGIEPLPGGGGVENWQREKLEKWGIPVPDTSSEADSLINEFRSRSRRGLCTFRMAKVLVRNGYSPDTPFDQAREIMDRLAANGWRPLK